MDTWSFRPRQLHKIYQISDLRLTSIAPKKSLITIKQKLQLNNIYGPRRPPAPRLSPVKSPEHTHQSPAGVSRFRALRGPRLKDVQNALPTGQRVGRRGPPFRLTTKQLTTQKHKLSPATSGPLSSAYIPLPPSAAVASWRHVQASALTITRMTRSFTSLAYRMKRSSVLHVRERQAAL